MDRSVQASEKFRYIRASYGLGMPILLMVLFVSFVTLLDSAPPLLWEGMFPPRALILNSAPGLILATFLTLLTRRPVFSFIVSGSIYLAMYWVSRVKTAQLGAPLMPQDLQIISISSIGLFANYMEFGLKGAISALSVLAAFYALFKIEPRICSALNLVGGLLALSAACLFHFWWNGLDPSGDALDRAGIKFEAWTPQMSVDGSGLINAFTIFGRIRAKSGGAFDEDEDESAHFVGRLLPVVGERAGLDGERPDIIVIQSEALFDPARIEGMQGFSFMPKLVAQGWRSGGPMYTPTYGGGTIRTEFEALTGISLRNLPGVQYPYLELDIDSAPSIVNLLADTGYRTFAIHPNNSDFWRRGDVFRSFGFEASIWKNGFSAPVVNDGPYGSDESLMDEAISLLQLQSEAPVFMFLITIQNHGPYLWHYSLTDEQLSDFWVPASLSADGARELRTYLYHLAKGEAQLLRLVDFLRMRDRPALVYVYGDHLPALPNVFGELGISGEHSETSAPSVWMCVEISATGCPPDSMKMASWKIPGFIKNASNTPGDFYYAMKYALPTEIVTLTRSPQAPPASPSHWVSSLDSAHRSVDAARMNGDFPRRLDKAHRAFSVNFGEVVDRVIVSPLVFGRYVDSRYRVVGVSEEFSEGERFFGYLDISGFVDDLNLEIVMRASGGRVLHRVAYDAGGVLGAIRKNFDFEGVELPSGEYLVDVVVEGVALSTSSIRIL